MTKIRYAVKEISTGGIVHTYERLDTDPDPWLFGTPWDNEAVYEKVLHPLSAEEKTAVFEKFRAEQINTLKQSGFARVFRQGGYPPHTQRRLALFGATDAQRIACRDLIIQVKAAVDAAETVMQSATTEAEIDTERDTGIAAVQAV